MVRHRQHDQHQADQERAGIADNPKAQRTDSQTVVSISLNSMPIMRCACRSLKRGDCLA